MNVNTWPRRILVVVGLLLLLAYVAVQVSFRDWRAKEVARIDAPAQYFDLPSGTIEFEVVGNGTPMLWLHGASGGHDQGPPIEGMRVIRPSRPGYLGTPLSTGETLKEAADAYADLLDALGVERVAVLGISAGGPSAIAFAKHYPERTHALILLSAISRERIRSLPERSTFARLTDVLVGEGFSDWLTVSYLSNNPTILLEGGSDDLLSVSEKERLREDPETFDRLVTQITRLLSLSARRHAGYVNDRIQYRAMGEPDLVQIIAPTLVVHGTDDLDVSLAHGESAARRIPGATLLPIEGGGHLVSIIEFERIFSAVRLFLDDIPEVVGDAAAATLANN